MSSSETVPRVMCIEATCSDPFVEVVIVSPEFQRLSSGFGGATASGPPGIYRVDFKAGTTVEERFVILDPASEEDVVHVEHDALGMDFRSTVPLAPRRLGDERSPRHSRRHLAALAHAWSRQPHVDLAEGSCVFVFAQASEAWQGDHPLAGITLHDEEGGELLSLWDAGEWDPRHRAAGVCSQVAPASYRLRYRILLPDEPDGGPRELFLEQSIVAAPGWATQVFLRQVEGGGPGSPGSPRPPDCSILMSRLGAGFDPDSPDAEVTEMAHTALKMRRHGWNPEAIHRMLLDQEADPMLGILAGHLLVLAAEKERESLPRGGAGGASARTAGADGVSRTVDLLAGDTLLGGAAHPDVLALRLWLGEDPRSWPEEHRAALGRPPMLRSSYSLLTAATARYPELVGPETLTAQVADGIWSGGVWLLWEPPVPGSHALQRVPSRVRPVIARLNEGLRGGGALEDLFRRRVPGTKLRRVVETIVPIAKAVFRQPEAAQLLKAVPLADLARRIGQLAADEEAVQALEKKLDLSPIEAAVLQYVRRAATANVFLRSEEPQYTSDGHLQAQVSGPRLSELFRREELVRAIGAPAGAIAAAVGSLALKIGLEVLGPHAESEAAATTSCDTRAGQFGGMPERNGRRVSATVTPVQDNRDWFDVEVSVESTDPERPLAGPVEIFLHETFIVPSVSLPVENGRAVWKGRAWGAFTIGVRCDGGGTLLELDLATLPGEGLDLFRSR